MTSLSYSKGTDFDALLGQTFQKWSFLLNKHQLKGHDHVSSVKVVRYGADGFLYSGPALQLFLRKLFSECLTDCYLLFISP